VANFLTVETLHLSLVSVTLLLTAGLHGMSELLAVAALRNAAINSFTCIGKSGQVLLWGLWPSILLLGTLMLGRQAIRNRVLLIKVALEIHVRISDGQLLLHSDEIHVEVLASESGLQLRVGCIRNRLEILLDSNLEVIKIALI